MNAKRSPHRLRLIRALFAAALLSLVAACSEPDRPSITLYLAVQRGDLDQLERHLYWGTDVNAVLPNGQYPLHVAADKGRIIMVKTLLKHGADIDRLTNEGDSALDLAILAGRTQIAEVLLAQDAKLDPSALLLKLSTAGGTDRDSLRFLLERGADLEARNAEGDTALLIAIRQDNHRLATHLVNAGADVNVTAHDGQSALALARSLNTAELVSLLQRFGAR
ncbi:MAG: ankyrin repeat domain-containing protein [Gammaproteobacteria bacterium]|nr:ankyrin repeat domain-containing protein [Gammaproteobacteria bacterium]MCB1923986.1 ankyrin repeat domain-containing protein [Gammaproteobacteria bacterium]